MRSALKSLIAGGGLAGGALAVALAKAGRPVTLLERDRGPSDKICGEFLSVEAQAYLARLGIDLTALGGQRIERLRLVRGAEVIDTRLPFHGVGLSRRVLDDALLQQAAAAGADVRRGHVIRHVDCAGRPAVEVEGLGTLRPEALFLATGKHELRGLPRRDADGPAMVGFKMYFSLRPDQRAALAEYVELILFKGGYAGLQLVEQGRANLCFLASRAMLAGAGHKFAPLLDMIRDASPHLAARLDGATALLEAPLAIAAVPYGFMHRAAPDDPPQVFRLGDQAAVIQSFTGDGMSIALHSAALAARCHLAGQTSAVYHQRLQADIGGQMRRAGMIQTVSRSGFSQAAMFALGGAWPGSLRLAARLTRVPRVAAL